MMLHIAWWSQLIPYSAFESSKENRSEKFSAQEKKIFLQPCMVRNVN